MAPEKSLVARLKKGDQAAWAHVFETHRQGIFYACLRRVRRWGDAEDLCSQVFVRAIGSIEGFRGESSVKTWLHTIASNLCLTLLTTRSARERRFSPDIIIEDHESDEPWVDRLAEGQQIRTAVEREIGRLDLSLREAIHLRIVEDMSYEEIAKVTGVTVNTVKSRIFRAREQLQQRLADYR